MHKQQNKLGPNLCQTQGQPKIKIKLGKPPTQCQQHLSCYPILTKLEMYVFGINNHKKKINSRSNNNNNKKLGLSCAKLSSS